MDKEVYSEKKREKKMRTRERMGGGGRGGAPPPPNLRFLLSISGKGADLLVLKYIELR